MRRVPIAERVDWQAMAEASGFTFHHEGGQRYWDERAMYAFTLEEVERGIEEPTAELHAMCLQLVAEAAGSEALMARLAIPESVRDYVAESWRSGAPSLYGRFDFAYDGAGPAKLLEYNADTPTSIYETGYFQWAWLESRLADGLLGQGTDQFNSLHEKLIARFGALFTTGSLVHFASVADHIEDRQTVAYLQDLAGQAGLETAFVPIDRVGLDADGKFVDEQNLLIGALFKLYPWEDMFREPYAGKLGGSGTTFLEPAWKAVLSNKAMLPLLWERHRGHPNLLPAFFADDAQAGELGNSYVRKPFFSREGWDVELVDKGRRTRGFVGGYGAEGHIVQGLARLPRMGGKYPVLGSWVVGDEPAGLSIREDRARITRNLSRFVPHVIEG
ncbi:MAG: Putative acid--amine ligase YgiC [uncultured Sphingomonadaceae bacterium]|uniref:Acid--amine ligase YgiC n=1 Tax=uncultured Sphingomonadaceae bacterium TaxID=169976 RepID=A0A6J4S0M1_9SPHN|nr:MAG: Putative acid--amine ligase YgiC [uncultured Sphingomonadaceae bacterium]